MGASFASPSSRFPSTENSLLLLPLPTKRARLETTSPEDSDADVHNCGPRPTIANSGKCIGSSQGPHFQWSRPQPQKEPQQPRWAGLPYVALVEIFRYLPNSDKYNASLTCRAWQLPLSRPALWRRGNFRFNGADDWRALCFASLMGGALRYITVDCSTSGESKSRPTRSIVENLSVFLTSLVRSKNHQVVSLTVSHLRRLAKHLVEGDYPVISPLTQFLAAQESLISLDLEHAGLNADEGFQLLTAAADASGVSVRRLSFSEVICPVQGYDIAADTRLLQLMARFTALSHLSLSHRYLSDDLLFLLASILASTLTHISVWASYLGRAYSRTTSDAWRHLGRKCPGLEAHFTVKGVSHDRTLQDILTPAMPLTHLHWSSGGFTTMVNTKVCFEHITSHFQEHLKHLELDLFFSFFDDEEDLAGIIEKCPKLEVLLLRSSLTTPTRQVRLERAVRRSVARLPRPRLREVKINGDEVSLEETWLTAVVGWLVEHVH